MKGQGEEEEEVKQTQTYDCVSIIGADTDEIGVFLKQSNRQIIIIFYLLQNKNTFLQRVKKNILRHKSNAMRKGQSAVSYLDWWEMELLYPTKV